MCIIAVAAGCHEDYPLVCIHNREEEAGRPTTACERRPNQVICALDELKGGTWMGMNVQSGVFCSLNNLRATNPPRAKPASRGLLVNELLEDTTSGFLPELRRAAGSADLRSCEAHLRAAAAARPYEGLNLCVGCWHPTMDGSPPAVFYVSNVPPGANATEPGSRAWKLAWSRGWTQHTEQLTPGVVHAWSNGAPAASPWPKSTWLRSNLARLLSAVPSTATSAASSAIPEATTDTAGLDVVQETGFEGCATCTPSPATTQLLLSLCALLSTTNDYTEAELPQNIPHFSPLERWQEAHLQRGPFVRHSKRWTSYGGTRSQTIVVADRSCRVTWYCYRETDSALPGGGVGQPASADSADHRVHVFGVPWPLEADGGVPTAGLAPCMVGVAALASAAAAALGIAVMRRWQTGQ
jgi:uncharacterized protein with NRDE domain